jgi:hypothetical protein
VVREGISRQLSGSANLRIAERSANPRVGIRTDSTMQIVDIVLIADWSSGVGIELHTTRAEQCFDSHILTATVENQGWPACRRSATR